MRFSEHDKKKKRKDFSLTEQEKSCGLYFDWMVTKQGSATFSCVFLDLEGAI